MSKKVVISLLIVSILTLVLGIVLFSVYSRAFKPNVIALKDGSNFLYIREGDRFEDVLLQLSEKGFLIDDDSFEWMAKYMEYDKRILSGKYKIIGGQSNYQFIARLRAGMQVPVNVTFINLRTIPDLAHVVCRKIDVDSTELVSLLSNQSLIDTLGFNQQTIISMFVPNTYQFFWATNAKKFLDRMRIEYNTFWNTKRVALADRIGFSRVEVAILASIVDEESNKNDEKPLIAGLYINRIKKRIPLQADPTIKFALNDFARKRILTADLAIDSPYNTYKELGLPPGPIRIPSVEGLEAVLNYKQHDYIFMCAKEDFSGYHNFSRTLSQHNVNARRYQCALQQMGIKR